MTSLLLITNLVDILDFKGALSFNMAFHHHCLGPSKTSSIHALYPSLVVKSPDIGFLEQQSESRIFSLREMKLW